MIGYFSLILILMKLKNNIDMKKRLNVINSLLLIIVIGCKKADTKLENKSIQKEIAQSNSLSIDYKNDIPKLHETKVFLLEKGAYFISTKVESITTGENIHLKFNFFVENNKKMNLRISTNNSDDAYCEGNYKLIALENIIKAEYDDEGICTDEKEESNFYFKNNNGKYFIKSKRFINQDWQEIMKE